MELPSEGMSNRSFLIWLAALLGFNIILFLIAYFLGLKLPKWDV